VATAYTGNTLALYPELKRKVKERKWLSFTRPDKVLIEDRASRDAANTGFASREQI
jgi:hypothetical protein